MTERAVSQNMYYSVAAVEHRRAMLCSMAVLCMAVFFFIVAFYGELSSGNSPFCHYYMQAAKHDDFGF